MNCRLLYSICFLVLAFGCASPKPSGRFQPLDPPQSYPNIHVSLFWRLSDKPREPEPERFGVLKHGDVVFSFYWDGHAAAELGNEALSFYSGDRLRNVENGASIADGLKTLIALYSGFAVLPEAIERGINCDNNAVVAKEVRSMLLSSDQVSLNGTFGVGCDVVVVLRLTTHGRQILQNAQH